MTFSDLWPYVRDGAALLAAAFGVVTYRRNQRQRRAEWLDQLYTRFFEKPQYKRIRRVLDYETEPALSQLRVSIESGKDTDASEELVDYLNFFEFLGSLRKMDQLSDTEISMLFEYYLARLNDHPFVVTFIEQEGFEELATMCAERRPRKRLDAGT